MNRKIWIYSLILAMLLGLSGCAAAGDDSTLAASTPPASQPSTDTGSPAPPVWTGSYYTALKVNYSDIYVTEVTATYGENTITCVHTSDDYTYTNTYDFYGNLLEQKIDGPDGFSSVETRTYADPETYGKPSLMLSTVYVRGDFRSELTQTYTEQGKIASESYTSTDGNGYTDTYTYNDAGKLTRVTKTKADGSTSYSAFDYDEAGNQVGETVCNSDGEITRIVTRTYREDGKLLQEVTKAGSVTTCTFTYDDAGNLILERQTWGKRNWLENQYTYNAAGQVTCHVYDEYKGTKTTQEYTYSDQGLLLTSTYTSGDYASRDTHTYDAAGRLTQTVTVSGDDTTRTNWSYDEAGNLIEESYTEADGSQSFDRYTYDSYGNVLTYTHTAADGTVTTSCSYTFGYTQLADEKEVQRLNALMETVFVEFLP